MDIVCHAAGGGAAWKEQTITGQEQSGWLLVEDILAKQELHPPSAEWLRKAREATPAVDIIRRDRDSR